MASPSASPMQPAGREAPENVKLAAIGKLLDADETAQPGTVIDVKKLLGW